MERVAFGPPAINAAKLLALIEAYNRQLAAKNCKTLDIDAELLDRLGAQLRVLFPLREDVVLLSDSVMPWLDVEAFGAACRRARETRAPGDYRSAGELYRGDLLDGFFNLVGSLTGLPAMLALLGDKVNAAWVC